MIFPSFSVQLSCIRCFFIVIFAALFPNLACSIHQRPKTERISKPDVSSRDTEKSPQKIARKCTEPPSASGHSLFSILINGLDVGREVRTDVQEQGPLGMERIISSHTVWQMKMGALKFENHTIKVERTLLDTALLLRGSFVDKRQDRVDTVVVGYNGEIWNRLSESMSSTSGGRKASKLKDIDLEGVEVVGLLLFDLLRDVAIGRQSAPKKVKYYEPRFKRPLEISVSEPIEGETELHGQKISGSWIEVKFVRENRIGLRAFFDENGTLWEEQYPFQNEVHRRLSGPLTFAEEKTELIPELQSDAYLGDPENATSALFRLSSSPQKLEALEALEQPVNQRFVRKEPGEFVLEVRAGAPDDDTPKPEDLASTKYINTRSIKIVSALRYLRSAGKRGHLPRLRRYNATPVVSRASLVQRPKLFWSNPVQVAGLVMDYVHALLPDKRRVTMSDAVKALSEGLGDCTEHAVLFASLMRAHGVPTRIVAGLHLTTGGRWEYHMWNSYWDGDRWLNIDPSSVVYKPGALYVAIGHGMSRFEESRDQLDDFINSKFKEIKFDLIEAYSSGVRMPLAVPRAPDEILVESALFNASALLDRGDNEGALSLIQESVPAEGRPISVKLMVADLLSRAGRCSEALEMISAIRMETSSENNIEKLDMLQFDCLLATGRTDDAQMIYEQIIDGLPPDDGPSKALLEAKYLKGIGEELYAIETLSKAVDKYPDDTRLLWTYADYTASSDPTPDAELLEKATAAAGRAVMETMSANCEALLALSKVLFTAGRLTEAGWILDHALILAPRDKALRELRLTIMSEECAPL